MGSHGAVVAYKLEDREVLGSNALYGGCDCEKSLTLVTGRPGVGIL